MSTRRRRAGAQGEPPRDQAGRPLCRWCGKPVKPPRRTFCDDACVHEWRLRSDPGYVRRQVFARDRGVCSRCGLDAGALEAELGRLWEGIRRAERRARRGTSPLVIVEAYGALEAWCAAHGLPPRAAGHFWEAHHAVAVVEGGGECGMDGYATLCLPCHRVETAALANRRASGAGRQP